MNIILIRHGSKDEEKASQDKDMLLSDEGIGEACKLGDRLYGLRLMPDIYLTSNYQHTRQMGNVVAKHVDGKTPPSVLGLDALTSHGATKTLEETPTGQRIKEPTSAQPR
jgi:phosphohistidine phosphatase SixA